jgi:Family of unknown function (DUF6338)
VPATFIALLIAVAAVLPGFVTVELSQRGRAVQSGGDAQSTVLRALYYALLIHLVWSWWTWDLVQDLSGGRWQDHLDAVVLWSFVVLVLSPIVVGLPLNYVLHRAESKGSLKWWHYALGGRDARDAWDVVFQRAAVAGAWLLVHLKGDQPDSPRIVLGKYGSRSAAGQSPAEHDLFVQELWAVDAAGKPVSKLEPARGMWVSKEEIAEIYLFDRDPTKDEVPS